MKANPTKEQLVAGFQTLKALAEAVRELRSVPSGHVYATVMSVLSLEEYNKCIGILKDTGLVSENAQHVLTWNEPK